MAAHTLRPIEWRRHQPRRKRCPQTIIARNLGQPRAARAVGGAVAANPIAYLVPCHRVIRSTGSFGDYRWGALRKRVLLSRELAQAQAA